MPYEITKKGKKWVVRNKDTGRVMGTHSSKADAKKQLRAVYARTGGK